MALPRRQLLPATLLLAASMLAGPGTAATNAETGSVGATASSARGDAIAQTPASAAAPDDAAALQAEAWRQFLSGSEAGRLRALTLLEQAAIQLQRSGALEALARLQEMRGLILFALARYRESNQAYEQALELYGRLGRPQDQTRLRMSLAMGSFNLSDDARTAALLRRVLSDSERSGDTQMLSTALELEAQLEARRGRPQAALQRLERSYALTGARGDTKHQLEVLDSMLLVVLPLGQVNEARQLLERRRALAPDQPSPMEALVKALETRSRPEDVVSTAELEERIRRFRQAGDLTNTAASLEALATVEVNRGRLQQGLALYEEALALYERQGMQGRAAASLRNIGQTQAALGDYGRSLSSSGRALQLARQAGDPQVEAKALLDLAELQTAVGSYELAIGSAEAALSLAERQQDLFRQAQALNALADLQRRLHKPAKALELAQRALAIGSASRMPLLEASALSTLVRAQESLGQLEPAQTAAERIRELGRSSGDRWISASGDAMLARVLLAKGQPAAALEALGRAIPLFEQQQQALALAASLDVRARSLRALGRNGPALEAYVHEQQLCEAMGDRRCQAEVLYEQSRLQATLQQPEKALALIQRSLAITESLRSTLPSTELRQSYFSQVQDQYDWCIELLLQLHRQQPARRFDLKALEVSERARARGLVELLSAARAELQSGIDPQLLARRRDLDSRIRALLAGRLRLRQGSGSDPERARRLSALEGQLADLQAQQELLEQQLRRRSPGYAALLLPQTLEPAAIQALLDDDTLLLEMHLGEKQGVLWLISRQGIESHPLPSRDAIQTLVAAFHRGLQDNSSEGAAAALSQQLLQPVAGRLAGKRLAIVPHGSLFYLPFAALPEPGGTTPLVVSHELVTLPSASTLAILRSTPAPPRENRPALLVLADPVFTPDDARLKGRSTTAVGGRHETAPLEGWQRLPGTALEAQAIAALLPAGSVQNLELGFQASRPSLLMRDLRAYRWLHIATHGQADGLRPERSRLVLSLYGPEGRQQQGNLDLQDIYNLQLAADLVVLSACQSGLGPLVRGEGLVGLTRGFQYAGARRVLASLWNVDDSSTATLMGAFYRGLIVDRLTPAAALRQAQRSLQSDPATASPYHWAAFTLHGDWR